MTSSRRRDWRRSSENSHVVEARGTANLGRGSHVSGYLFLLHEMDKATYVEVSKANGLVSILGERWDRLESVPETEIMGIKQASEARVPMFPHTYLREGQRVRIVRGPMADVEGIFLQGKPHKGLLVLSIEMLRQERAVEVDCPIVAPTYSWRHP